MKIYIIQDNTYYDGNVIGVTDSEEEAKRIVESNNGDVQYEEYELNKICKDVPVGMKMYEVGYQKGDNSYWYVNQVTTAEESFTENTRYELSRVFAKDRDSALERVKNEQIRRSKEKI
jgi:hypothetical protein